MTSDREIRDERLGDSRGRRAPKRESGLPDPNYGDVAFALIIKI